mgnify:CR=1 FL=1
MQELLERKKGLHRKILIVDDELIAREILGAMLSDVYDVDYAEDGRKALEILKRDSHLLSLVILDLHMPELDGVSLLKILHADNELRRIPVIVLTSEKGSEVECLQNGAADFITKPFDAPEIIRARVGRSIELAEDSVIIHETERDSLTGLFNKEFFFEYGKKMDQVNGHMPMDAIVLDINRFRIINELYGRAYGDLLLKKIGRGIHEVVREYGGLACRSDSNCFMVYIPHEERLSEVMPQYIERLERGIDDHNISVRIGIYSDVETDIDMEMRFDRARIACRKLRNTYTNSFNLYNSDLHEKELFEERLINDMDKALAEKQFQVFYQPKYNIRGEVPVLASAEALIRWFHPDYDMISPGVFIPLFENNGLIHELDRFVWNEAAAQIREWKDKFGITLPISVNVSRVDVFDPQLGEEFMEIVRKNDITANDLLLEITESAYTENSRQISDTVSNLRELGFRIEMDDFGSGYSSLNMLTSLAIDALKLDMAFIRNICTDRKAARLVEIMIEIARLLDVPVIAEGVEEKQQMDRLKEIGCDIIQGYYFSRPLPSKDFEELIKKYQREIDHEKDH